MTAPSLKIGSVETSVCVIEKNDLGIIIIRLKENAEIGIPQVDEISDLIIQFSNDTPCFILVVPGLGSHSDQESREYAAKFRSKRKIVAEAIVVQNLPIRILANFYIKFNKPKQQVRLFGSEEDGMNWLLALKEQHGK
jgi:hypothetical protein